MNIDSDSDRRRAEVEARLLTTEDGRRLLEEMMATADPAVQEIARWRRSRDAETVRAALDLTAARRAARGKFLDAEALWLNPLGVEQSTSWVIAEHKASRFGGAAVFDLCSGLGNDARALARRAATVAIDQSWSMCRRLRWNARVWGVDQSMLVVRGDASALAIPPECHVHIDPDRRAGSAAKRARALADYQPGTQVLRRLIAGTRGGALKVGPVSDFESVLPIGELEVEWLSERGECKGALLWWGELRGTTHEGRVTLLPEARSWICPDARPPGKSLNRDPRVQAPRWIFDADPALRRSGWLSRFAEQHGLTPLKPGASYLVGEDQLDSPFLRAYEVIEVLAWDIKRVKARVKVLGLGPLEIKTRGVRESIESLRSRLDPTGPHPATLLIAAGEGPGLAVLARDACVLERHRLKSF